MNEIKQKLSKLLSEIEQSQRFADEDLSGWDPRTVGGAMIRKREAQEKLKQLKAAYSEAISGTFFKVFVSGPRAAEFAKATDAQAAIVVDCSELYSKFADSVEPTLDRNQRQFTATQISVLIRVIQNFMTEHAVPSVQMPKLDPLEMDTVTATKQDLLEKVRKSVRNTNGDKLLLVDLTARILEQALSKKIANTVTPIILTGLSPDELQSVPAKLFPLQANCLIEANEDSEDEEIVEKINKQIFLVFKKQ